jgi:hypothetical protein
LANAAARTDYMAPALVRFNGIMGTSHTITDDTTSDSHVDEAVAWMAASMNYSEDHTTKRDANRGGMFIWEIWEQQAYKVMFEIDQTKFNFNKGSGIFTLKEAYDVWTNAYIRNNATDSEEYGA